MSFNPTGRAEVDPSSPRAFAVCDRCGRWYNHRVLQWQYEWAGLQLINLGALVCEPCLDIPQIQLKTVILPSDPAPILNARVDPFSLDEDGPVQELTCELAYGHQIGSSFYLDLYDADPDNGGVSVLSTLAGSATRTNYASSMSAAQAGQTRNSSIITITSSAEGTASVAWVVVFDAPTGGSRMMDGQLEPPQTVTESNGAAFAVGALWVLLSGYMRTQSNGFILQQDGSSYIALQ